MPTTHPLTPRVLIVSSFVLPHAGGVEQFVERASELLSAHGARVRLLACARDDARADAYVPALFLGKSEWPLLIGGLRTLWSEIGESDVVLLNSHRHPLTVAGALLARLRRRRCLLVVHTSDAGAVGPLAYRLIARSFDWTLTRLAFALATVVTFSPAAAELARALRAKPLLLPFPLPDMPSPRQINSGQGGVSQIVWVGRLSEEKDPLISIDAVEQLRTELPAELHIYGDGPLREELAGRAETRTWLHLHGTCPRTQVIAAQRKADVCLGSSRTESAHLAVLEALIQGVPCAATAVGDVPTYFAEKLARFCVPARDSSALAAALRELLSGDYGHEFLENAERLRLVVTDDGQSLCDLVLDSRRQGGSG
jgi:glycosyltransferase involved in cell wall biosynthesis